MESKQDSFNRVEQLQKINASISIMVQFGESKNGVLLGVNIAILYNVAIKSISFADPLNAVLSVLAILFFAISTIILLYSIVPKIVPTKGFNPLFFGGAAKMDAEKYHKICAEMTEDDLVCYYAEQIQINSGIASRKFADFRKAVIFALPSYLFFALLYLLNINTI